MPDSSLAFTTVAAICLPWIVVALLWTALQFPIGQNIKATGRALKKCDRDVCGRLTRGGTYRFDRHDFRFRVRYEGLCFTLPKSVYDSLDVIPAVRLDSSSPEIWRMASDPKKKIPVIGQACWVSFVRDMVGAIRPDGLGVKWASGDRLPEDIMVAPIQVDYLTVLLLAIASGLKVDTYAPLTGELTMYGRPGSMSTTKHPILGSVINYSPTSVATRPRDSKIGSLHAMALNQEKGVWANAVFGKFNLRNSKRGYQHLSKLRALKLDTLEDCGWPDGSYRDTIGGAACFMTFADVDVYNTVPPSVIRRWTAHFAEIIVKIHLLEVEKTGGSVYPEEFLDIRAQVIDENGCSSPFADWSDATMPKDMEEQLWSDIYKCTENRNLQPIQLATPGLIEAVPEIKENPTQDPSSAVDPTDAIELMYRADYTRSLILRKFEKEADEIQNQSSRLIAASISSLAEAGAPSWGGTDEIVSAWAGSFHDICARHCSFHPENANELLAYTKLSLLRAAYYTIMMRGAGRAAEGLKEGEDPLTRLCYMA